MSQIIGRIYRRKEKEYEEKQKNLQKYQKECNLNQSQKQLNRMYKFCLNLNYILDIQIEPKIINGKVRIDVPKNYIDHVLDEMCELTPDEDDLIELYVNGKKYNE